MSRLPLLFILLLPTLLWADGEQRLPAYLLEIPASIETILVAETSTSTLHRFERQDGAAVQRSRSYMSVGQNGVGKQRAWDRKTPLGIYFVNEQLDTSKLHEKYGPTAFPLDYPNIWDRLSKRSGDGIWIHGVTPGGGKRPPRDTDGCIALPNDELLALQPELVPRVTPVLITREIAWAEKSEMEVTHGELRRAVDTWARSLGAGDLFEYLGLYADDFSYRGMTREDWAAFRTQSFTRAPASKVDIDDVLLLADPEEEGLFLSRFVQNLVYEDRTVTTVKRLYWRRTGDGEFRIVAEDNG